MLLVKKLVTLLLVCVLLLCAFTVTASADYVTDGNGSTGDYDLALIRAMILGIDNSLWTE